MQDFTLENYIPQLSIDCVIFGFSNKKLFVLLPQLESEHQIWALPGGFIKQDENIEEAAQRILKERTNLEAIYLEQFAVFGHKNRINNLFLERENQEKIHYLDTLTLTPSQQEWLSKRFVSIGYFALVDMHKVNPQKGMLDESIHWVALPEIPQLIIDHNQMIDLALKRLRERIDDNLLASRVIPALTTIRRPVRQMAQLATTKMIMVIEQNDKAAQQVAAKVAPTLVVRESTAQAAKAAAS